MATNLKICVYKKTKLETTFSVPCKVIKLGTAVLPSPVVEILKAEGIAIEEIAKLAAKPDLTGILVEVERHGLGDKVIVSLD